MAFTLALALVAVPAEPPRLVPPRQGTSETIALFDGKSLEGWEGHPRLWSVKEGVVVGKYEEVTGVNTFLLTKKSYSDMHLRVSAKVVKSEIHTAIAFWGKKGDPAKTRDPFGYEAGYVAAFPMRYGLVDKFGREFLKVDTDPWKKACKDKEWNEVEVLAQGNRVRMAFNGTLVLDWVDPQTDRLMPGPIGLELHGGKVAQEVHFKDVVVTTFPKDTSRFDGVKVGDPLNPPKK